MASTKKGKKNKGKTLPLIDFLSETPGVVPTMPIRKSTMNWADEVDDAQDVYDPRSSKSNVILPTAPKASRDFDDISDKIPQKPPYQAFLSNLPYDVDENEIEAFFKNLRIVSMRIPKDERSGETPKLKGYGYVEFEDRESLMSALVLPDTTIKNRRIRIDLADNDSDKRRGGRMDMNRDRGGRSGDIPTGDWRSGPRVESSMDSERRGYSRDRDRDDRDSSSASAGQWREGARITRDRDMDRDRDRNRFSRGPDNYDKYSRDDRDDRDREFSRDDRFNRNRDRERDRDHRDDEPSRGPPQARERPKLKLAPRTKPVESVPEKAETASGSIFGNAKPVDTSARERQIEERLAKESELPARESSKDRRSRDLSKERRVAPREASKERKSGRELSKERKSFKEDAKNEKNASDSSKTEKEVLSDHNGISEKSHIIKKNGDHEKKEQQHIKNEKSTEHVEKIRHEKHEKQEKHDKHEKGTKREEKREKHDKEMPKLKKQDPPNFIGSNKFAYLENEDTSE